MKQITAIFLLFTLAFSSCRTYRTAQQPLPSESEEMGADTHVLIVYYDVQKGKKSLLEMVKKLKAELIYDYQNFSAIAISLPENADVTTATKQLEQTEGVLQVNRDQKMQLH